MSSAICCAVCHETFDTEVRRNQHAPQCHIVFKYPNGSILIRRNAQGQFLCQCAHPTCPRPFKNRKHLQVHINTVSEPWINRNVRRSPDQELELLLMHQHLEQALSITQALDHDTVPLIPNQVAALRTPNPTPAPPVVDSSMNSSDQVRRQCLRLKLRARA